MGHKMRKAWMFLTTITIVGIGVGIIGIRWWQKPVEIHKSTKTTIYKENTSYSLPVEVDIQGKWYKHLFKEDEFKGQLMIDQFEFTKDWTMDTLRIGDEEGTILQYITCDKEEFNKDNSVLIETKQLGFIWAQNYFEETKIVFTVDPTTLGEETRSLKEGGDIFYSL